MNVPFPVTSSNTTRSELAYPNNNSGRDLRLDFLRGLIMLVVITVHMEYFSLFSMFVWERLGLVSSAEGFVGLSGIVLGIVYKKRLLREGFKSVALKLWKRSFQLYRVNLFVILSIAVLGTIPFIDVHAVTHWAPIAHQDQSYLLYPPSSASWIEIVKEALLLRIGPHQFQVIGLYVGLIAMAPLALFCMHRRKTVLLIAASWSAFGINQMLYLRITGARFEFAFPSLTWQLVFINAMVVGYHHEKMLGYIAGDKNRVLILSAGLLSLGFLFLALNNPNRIFWPWPPLSFIDAVAYREMYVDWFQKSGLGLGRLMNIVALFIVFYYALSHYWLPLDKALGWLLVPLGQASLYVFILHVYFVLLVSNTSLPDYDSFFINTAIHATTILLIWAMVKGRVLFQVIPR